MVPGRIELPLHPQMAPPRIELGTHPRQGYVLPLNYEAKPLEGFEPPTFGSSGILLFLNSYKTTALPLSYRGTK